MAMILADGRFPSGGHAHSNGYEPADRLAGLATVEAIERFATNRLATSGAADATMIASLVERLRSRPMDDREELTRFWAAVDDELDARLLVPAIRRRSRALGRQWMRALRRLWPDSVTGGLALGPDGPHELAALAAVSHAAGLDPRRAALLQLHQLVSGITTAAVRLRGLDPYALQGVHLALLPIIDEIADRAEASRARSPAELRAPTGPLFELLAQHHAGWDDRLFQS